MKSGALLCTFSLIFFFFLTSRAQATTFRCNSTTTCQALIDYKPINSTTYSDVKTLFGVKNLRSIFGANSLPLSTSPNGTVPAAQTIRVPFPCACSNGTGISNKRPIYIVKAGNGLDFIGRTIFSNLVTYQQIAAVNNISNPDLIEVGQELVIPLPCSCDDVEGMKVVHYGHVVPAGSTVEGIAGEFGTTEAILLRLNNFTSASDLMADSVIDVPLRACTSAISDNSLDYPLLVPNGTYTFTANNCVQCMCDQANNWKLHCAPASMDVLRRPNWPQCLPLQCDGNISIGNTSSSATCGRTCTYTGYTNNQTILTSLINDSNCTSNDATDIGLGLWSWTWLLISLQLGLGLLW